MQKFIIVLSCLFTCLLASDALAASRCFRTWPGGETTMIVPSHDLVVVRLGHYKGEATGTVAFQNALTLLMQAVPRRN